MMYFNLKSSTTNWVHRILRCSILLLYPYTNYLKIYNTLTFLLDFTMVCVTKNTKF